MSRVYKIVATLHIVFTELCRWPCRGCGQRVTLLDDVCTECGTYAPLRLPCSFVIQSAFLSASAILLIRITQMIAS